MPSSIAFNDRPTSIANLLAALSAWTLSNVTRTVGQTDPLGGTSASLLDATVASGTARGDAAFTANGTKVFVVALKAGTGAQSIVRVTDDTATANRYSVTLTWTAGVPSVTASAGSGTNAIFPIGGGFYVIALTADSVVAANTNRCYVEPAAAGTGTVYAYSPEAYNGSTVYWVELKNGMAVPGDRFASWTPDSLPFGDAKARQSDGATTMFRFRDDHGATFELPHISSRRTSGIAPADLANRLVYHLANGGSCAVQTGDAQSNIYSYCGVKPGTSPTLRLTNKRAIEYTLSLHLLNLAPTPTAMLCRYSEL